MTHRGPFQPVLFCSFVNLWFCDSAYLCFFFHEINWNCNERLKFSCHTSWYSCILWSLFFLLSSYILSSSVQLKIKILSVSHARQLFISENSFNFSQHQDHYKIDLHLFFYFYRRTHENQLLREVNC